MKGTREDARRRRQETCGASRGAFLPDRSSGGDGAAHPRRHRKLWSARMSRARGKRQPGNERDPEEKRAKTVNPAEEGSGQGPCETVSEHGVPGSAQVGSQAPALLRVTAVLCTQRLCEHTCCASTCLSLSQEFPAGCGPRPCAQTVLPLTCGGTPQPQGTGLGAAGTVCDSGTQEHEGCEDASERELESGRANTSRDGMGAGIGGAL